CPLRAFCPLTPLPDCSPVPEPGPRPMRLRLRVAPRGPFNVESVVPMWFVPWLLNLFGLFDPDQVRDGADHATHRHVIWQRYGDTQLAEAEPLAGPLALLGAVAAAPD